MTETTNYHLKKPDYTETADIADINYNADLLDEILSNKVDKSNTVDLIVFGGQSNMAGRGITDATWTETAPSVPDGVAYEYRAITDPNTLHHLTEPFGVAENNPSGIDDGNKKTGSMVSAFVNAYYKANGSVPIVGVSASVGGTRTSQWQISSAEGYLPDLINRYNAAVAYLTASGYTIRHKYLVWCQGESDGDNAVSESTYKDNTKNIRDAVIEAGMEAMLIVQIGNINNNSTPDLYKPIIASQKDLCRAEKDMVLISCDFAGMKKEGLMKDQFHYYQAGYNRAGEHAGEYAAYYAMTGIEPIIYDTQLNNLYYSHSGSNFSEVEGTDPLAHTLSIATASGGSAKVTENHINNVTMLSFDIQKATDLVNGKTILAADTLRYPPSAQVYGVIIGRTAAAWATATYHTFVVHVFGNTGQITIQGNDADLAACTHIIGTICYTSKL